MNVEDLVKRVAVLLDKNRVPYIIIGGQAVLVHGRVRMTRDIDITIGLDSDAYDVIEKICSALQLEILRENPKEFAVNNNLVSAEDKNTMMRVDFIFSYTPFEKQAMERANVVKYAGYPVKVVTAEDLIVFKMFAGRAIDEEDVKSVIIKNKGKMDFEYIIKWLSEFASIPGRENIVETFNKLSKSVQK